MDAWLRIDEGRLVERTCAHCGNVERRAFGDVESRRGELASYAIGWTSGHDDRVGHMTVGIGAGNPGGGSFHAVVGMGDDERWGMGLVDEPFEDVPQGGPDLTREEGLAHVDIDFVWLVADHVMELDRRARWMEHWLRMTPAHATAPVVERAEPVRHVIRHEDGAWRLLCGTTAEDAEPLLLHLFHALDEDQTLLDVIDLEPGRRADRNDPGRRWKRRKLR